MPKCAYFQKIPISLFLWEFRQFWIKSVSVVIDKEMDVDVGFVNLLTYFFIVLSFDLYYVRNSNFIVLDGQNCRLVHNRFILKIIILLMLGRELRLCMVNPLGEEQVQYIWMVLIVREMKVVFCIVTTANGEITLVTTLEMQL